MKFFKTLIFLLASIALTNCADGTSKNKQDTAKNNSDTLRVAYTYWWPSGGPFIGLCGDAYSLVFTGTVMKVNKPSTPNPENGENTSVSYTAQSGLIKIKDIKVKNPLKEGHNKHLGKNYNGESYFKSDCFYDLQLKEGDKVIVFVYSYEGEYSIPRNSIVKIKSFEDPIVLSIEKYILNNQDPLVIRADTSLWREHGFGSSLKQIIECSLFDENE
jgi:hypothetical protein